MDLPLCNSCGARDWSLAATLTGTAFIRLRPAHKPGVYADLAPPDLRVRPDTYRSPFCSACGAAPAKTPVSNPEALKDAFDTAHTRHEFDADDWQLRGPLDPASDWRHDHTIDPHAWPGTYDEKTRR